MNDKLCLGSGRRLRPVGAAQVRDAVGHLIEMGPAHGQLRKPPKPGSFWRLAWYRRQSVLKPPWVPGRQKPTQVDAKFGSNPATRQAQPSCGRDVVVVEIISPDFLAPAFVVRQQMPVRELLVPPLLMRLHR